MEIERRYVPTDFEVRATGANTITIAGYAYKFGARSQNLGGFRETIAEGAGMESARTDDIRALFNHESSMILGRSVAGVGTLRLSEDSTGLHYETQADTRQTYVRNLQISMERGDVTQSSFGFQVPPEGDTWAMDESDFPLRTVLRMSLFDVSPVTYPAYTAATSGVVSQRSLDKAVSLATPTASPDRPGGLVTYVYIPSTPALPVDPKAARHALRG